MIPWLPHSAMEFLEGITRPWFRVFEWGSGESTVYWSRRVTSIVAIEHIESSFVHTKNDLVNYGRRNYTLLLIPPKGYRRLPPDPSEPLDYCSADSARLTYKDYATIIKSYSQLFDLIIVDGRARTSCLYHACNKLMGGGYLVLDNSDRAYYLRNIRHLFEDWKVHRFFGPGPHNNYDWECTVWRKPG